MTKELSKGYTILLIRERGSARSGHWKLNSAGYK
jgi:hypothetical protein